MSELRLGRTLVLQPGVSTTKTGKVVKLDQQQDFSIKLQIEKMGYRQVVNMLPLYFKLLIDVFHIDGEMDVLYFYPHLKIGNR